MFEDMENYTDLFWTFPENKSSSDDINDSTMSALQSFSEDKSNITSGVHADPKRDSLVIVIPITVIYALIFFFGIVGNISTCIVIAKNKHMHTATNYYLFSLAISDLLLLVSGLPPEMYYIWSRYPYVFGEAFCVLQGFAAETSANATVLTITAFTVERYVAICHPFQSHTMSKLSRAVKFVVAIWIVALCLAVPQAIQFGIVYTVRPDGSQDAEHAYCTIKQVLIEHAFEISTCVFFIAPMTVITVLYILIGVKLRHSSVLTAKRPSVTSSTNERGDGVSATRSHRGSGNQSYVIKMLVAVVVAFFICWAPFHAQRLLAVHAQSRNTKSRVIATVYAILTYLSGILYYLSTTVNPVLYHIMSHKFREAFKTTLAQQCGWGRKKIVKHRSYSVLSRYNHNVHNCAQPQQHLHRLPSASDDSPCQQLPEIQLRKINNNTSPEEKFKERKNNATENQGENLNNSYPQYHPRQRVPSNSSQTTMTTSLGKLSLGDGNNFRSDPTLALTQGENCLEEECVKENGTCTRNSDVANRGMPQSNRHMRECVCDNCRRFKADTTITPTKRFLLRSCSGVSPFGALTRKLRALSVSTKSMFVPHHKSLVNVDSLNNSSPQRHRVTSDASLNSGRSTNTISNSSLQDLDENEFVGAELALYMGELNGQS